MFSALNKYKACKAKAVCHGKTGPDAGGADGKTTARAESGAVLAILYSILALEFTFVNFSYISSY